MVIARVRSTAKLAVCSVIGSLHICLVRDCRKNSRLAIGNRPEIKGQAVHADRDRDRDGDAYRDRGRWEKKDGD